MEVFTISEGWFSERQLWFENKQQTLQFRCTLQIRTYNANRKSIGNSQLRKKIEFFTKAVAWFDWGIKTKILLKVNTNHLLLILRKKLNFLNPFSQGSVP